MTDSLLGYSVIVPVYNEAEGIDSVLNALAEHLPPEAEIIVVDDGSTDGTPEVLERHGSRVHVVAHPHNRGYGAALKTGIREARYERLVFIDGDGTYPSERIPDLVRRLENADMVVGMRSARSAGIPLVRRPAKWVLNKLANYLTGRRIPDLNSGLRAMRRCSLEPLMPLLPDGFSFTTTSTLGMIINGKRVDFEPIDYLHRKGRSKIRPIRDTLNFLQLIVRTVLYFEPLRIFIPAALFLFAASGAALVVSLVFLEKILDGTIVALFVAGVQMLGIGMLADLINRRIQK